MSVGTCGWGSEPWLAAVERWVEGALRGRGVAVLGQPIEHVTEAWSTVWRFTTDAGTFWFKENCAAHQAEGDIQVAAAQLAPAYIDAPIAIESSRGWMLTRDGGSTVMDAAPAGTRGVETDAMARLLGDYAQMQRHTVGHSEKFASAGLPVVDPRDAAEVARSQAELMAAMPADDPRHLTTERCDAVLAALPAITEAGQILAAGPVPLALDHSDLFPRNVFVARAPCLPYRFFDFAEAVWSHPFGSLVMLLWELVHRWRISMPDDVIDCRDQRIREVFDAYFEYWTDLAPMSEVRELAQYALRLAPLHRSGVWLRVLTAADSTALAKHGGTPWAWLQDVAKPVLL